MLENVGKVADNYETTVEIALNYAKTSETWTMLEDGKELQYDPEGVKDIV